MTETIITKRKTLRGIVVSDKMAKTLVVEVERFVKHPKFGKYIKRSKRYQAHYEPVSGSTPVKVGDKVEIRETRPLSRHKHFEVI